MKTPARFVLIASVLGAASTSVWAADQFEIQKITAAASVSGDEFGASVGVRDARMLVGARLDSSIAADAGRVFPFTFASGAWSPQSAFVASDAAADARFGNAVSAGANYAIVGAPRNADNGSFSGAAYLYTWQGSTWGQQVKVTASDANSFDVFGISAFIDGNYAIVGALGNDDGGNLTGSAYIFARNGSLWPQQKKLLASDRAVRDVFGTSVGISGDIAVVGAPGDQTSTSAGAVYLYRRSGTNWIEEDILVANDAVADDELGTSVAIDDFTAVGGAPKHGGAGAVYVFEDNAGSWPQTFKVTASNAVAGDLFGASVAIDGDLLVVGAPGADSGAGAMYVFKRSGLFWVELTRLVASDAAAGDALGTSVSISGDAIVGGAPFANGGAGAAYAFDAANLDCNANSIPDPCDIDCGAINTATGNLCSIDFPIPNCGSQTDCNTNGVPDDCEPDCDNNGLADGCDIVAGADDCNDNAVPDVCEYFNGGVLVGSDFNAGLPGGWSATGLWHVTSNCDQGGGCDALGWAYFGEDVSCSFETGAIESGVLSVEAGSIPQSVNAAYLEYCSLYDGDRGAAPSGFDAAWVTVNGAIVDDVGPVGAVGVWETRTVDLADYAGQAVTLEWHFDSVDNMSNDGVGWQIDQVELIVDADCNDNGALDACDILSGLSPDCDTNGIPDECDLDRGADDCNSNGIPDVCESAADCNNNELFDICEQRRLYVDRTATSGANDGSSWTDAYTSLQAALVDVNSNCVPAEVWVAAGTYRPAGVGGSRSASFVLTENVRLYGGFSGGETSRSERNSDPVTNNTVLSGDLDSDDIGGVTTDNSYHVVTANALASAPTIDGFTITGGVANGTSPNNSGAAMRIVSSKINVHNCQIKGNRASAGAVRCQASNVEFVATEFVANTSAFGGAVYFVTSSSGVFDRCRFLGNTAAYNASGGVGGAMFVSSASEPTLQNCVFAGNIADNMGNGSGVEANGGALYLTSTADPTIVNCTFTGNVADDFGGAIALIGGGHATIQNSILWSNSDLAGAGEASQIYRDGGTVTLGTSCVMNLSGGLGGVGNIALDPLFVDANGADNIFGTLDDLPSLAPSSPCIDAGNNAASFAESVATFDIDGLPRFADDPSVADSGLGTAPLVDMGAYERQPDCNNNGIPDAEDIASGTSEDCSLDGVPDECDPDCNQNAIPDSCDIASTSSNDCNHNAVPDECEIDELSTAPGGPFFCTGNCASDLNNNGVPDSCDISSGTSEDCNGSGIPDENKTDCNANGTPDVCEAFDPVFESSFLLSPVFGGAGSLQFIVNDMRPAVGEVTLTFSAIADLASPVETILVELNGTSLGEVFTGMASDCPAVADVDEITLSAALFNQIVGAGPATIVMTASAFVDQCPQGSSISVSITYLPVGDCNGNGVPDDCDIAGATSSDIDGNDVPDECEDCNGNAIPDVIDLANQTSDDANSNGIPDECEDCNTNGIPDDLDISMGASFDDNANEIPDECEDCNNNGTLDDLDIVNLTSDDCNGNGLPDECEISVQTPGGPYFCTSNCATDCNANGIPDACEIDEASSANGGPFYCTVNCDADCNDNGVPDDCDAANTVDCDLNNVPDECDSDADGDGAIDSCESCPLDGTKTEPGICGCGQSDVLDSDGDGVIDCLDMCPGTGPSQPVDADGCPMVGACCFAIGQCISGLDQGGCTSLNNGKFQGNGTTCTTDSDADGFTNCNEECPLDPDKTLAGICGCGVPDDDTDGDGVADCIDLCPGTQPAEMVDSNGCRELGACCSPGGTVCNDDIDQAFCESLPWIYQGNGSTCATNCQAPPPGDYDADGDVDLDDYDAFATCMSGPHSQVGFATPSALCRQAFDDDNDGDVDVEDFAAFQEHLADF
ncbi:MAG TPA: choice-of-anchor Q domain-containing protein [Phycisphaerae bacterium]|nr:choice-of-anchor Q domain-containing protein [Phycisphaerae bacterium]